MMDWVLPHFGVVGRWVVENPFSMLTLAIAGLVIWEVSILIRESLPVKSDLLGARGEAIYRSKLSPKFMAATILMAILAVSGVVYGD